MKKSIVGSVVIIMVLAGYAPAENGMKKKRPLPYDYGKIVLNNYSQKAGMGPVVFEHWLHRSKFTCRLCHVDIGFAMKAGTTGIKAPDNIQGYYCGACHNDKTVAGIFVFRACTDKSTSDKFRCERCHSMGKNVKPAYDFAKFTERFPKERFGNGINWEQAEAEGYIHLTDFLEGVSIKRKPLPDQKDFSVKTNMPGMPNILFSHKKHTVWSGCELCHPEIFTSVRKGATQYSMTDIYEGKYCGVCHSKVAFPVLDCQRCHTQSVQ